MNDASSDAAAAGRAPLGRRLVWPGGLSARLLLLTVLFALAGAVLILVPSLADYQEARYLDRIRAAELASLAVEAAPARTVSNTMATQLMNGAGVVSVAVQSGGVRRLLLEAPRLRRPPELVDLRNLDLANWLSQPFLTLFAGDDRYVRVVAKPRFRDGDFIEIVVPNASLKAELLTYLLRSMWVALFIAAVAGAGLYMSLNAFLVRPIQKLTRAIDRFRADPADPAAHIVLSGRRDEIGRAESELDRMQADLRAALASRARLAALGEAMAKINHDLRNMLSSAQLASERLTALRDPRVSQAMPRLERALDRAITLTTNVLSYGRSQEAAPQAAPAPLLPALKEAAEDAGFTEEGVELQTNIEPTEEVLADPEQLHRILVNLLRNAREAMEAAGKGEDGRVRVSLEQQPGRSVIRISDNGPGLPEKATAHLFQPFAGSGRPGGAGLGLAISRELAQAHGGDLTLAENGPEGATFELTLPEPSSGAEATPEAPTPPTPSGPLSPGEPPLSRSERRPRASGRRRPAASRRAP
jgi:signal transduction histidine kinase